jgi:hypothetical protein
MINFFSWIGASIIILITLSFDNIFWVSASPEFENYKKLGLFKSNRNKIIVEKREYLTKADYIFHYRIKSVFTNWRDLSASVIGGLLVGLIW